MGWERLNVASATFLLACFVGLKEGTSKTLTSLRKLFPFLR